MQCLRKEIIMLLLLNILHMHCKSVFKSENETEITENPETSSPELSSISDEKTSLGISPDDTAVTITISEPEPLNYEIKLDFKECNCGIYGLCHIDDTRSKCHCTLLTDDSFYGKCEEECKCGVNVRTSYIRSNGNIICSSDVAYNDSSEDCTGCDCGEGGSCHLNSSGDKICNCFEGYVPHEGYCKACDCGEGGSCHLNSSGDKICNCFEGYVPHEGYCKECNCGPYGSCSFIEDEKQCICPSFTVEINGVCEVLENTSPEFTTAVTTTVLSSTALECNCGPYGSCSFIDDEKRCDCKSFAVERNGVCIVLENTSPEFTTAVTTTVLSSTELGKRDFWMISQFSVASAILVLLLFMFGFWTRILKKISKK
ncbi:unnamed protein product [Larinioides sclopetarius]|uniref:EGF-like domain-containing protein n=1 Tax=Larinioides sclopetarius TaxID=280406 RepID=A0AAV2AGU9_9ARAC